MTIGVAVYSSFCFCYYYQMSNQLVIVSFFDKPPVNSFSSSEWPLHMTVVPPFTFRGRSQELEAALNTLAARLDPLTITTAGRELFGPNKDIPVALIERNASLLEVYKELTEVLDKLGIEYKHPTISGSNYRFHITNQRNEAVFDHANIPIKSFSLVDRLADKQTSSKKVIRTFEFGENTEAYLSRYQHRG